MRIYILALDEVFDTGLATVLDTFSIANDLAESAGVPSIRFEITVVGVRRRVSTSQGLAVPVVPAAQLAQPDVVLVPALGAKMPETLQAALERRDVADAGEWLRQWSDGGAVASAACTGTFVLANTSLLDGRSATTSWWLGPPVPRALPPRQAGGIAHGRGFIPFCHGRGGAGAYRSGAMADKAQQPGIGGGDSALPCDRPAFIAGGFYDSRPPHAYGCADRAI
ncbi:MAG: DJ-1/PfpI family protein [Nitrosospira sp.]